RFAPGIWITGGQWSAYEAWEAGTIGEEGRKAKKDLFKPHREMIDSFTKDRPVFIQRFDGNVFFANGKGLELAGIGRDLPNPVGITVDRDRKGNPTGILTGANVNTYFQKIIPKRSWDQRLLETQAVLDRCKMFGVTSLSDMSDPLQREIFYTLRNQEALTVRVHSRGYLDQWDKLAALGIKVGAGDEMIRLGAVKAWIDGIMGNSSARFYESYSHMPGERGRWRSIMFPWTAANDGREMVSNLENLAMKADSAGIQLSVHAIGDEGNGYLLDMMERMIAKNGQRDRRFRLVHAQVINPDHFKRFNRLGIVAEVQPYHCTDDMRWMEERIGQDRCVGAYAFRSLWDNGAVVCFGSDSPGTNAARYPLNPMLGLYAAVTRQTLTGEPDEGWFPEQKLTMEEAIQAYTLNSAYASFEESIKGSITVGKLADMAVLSDNLLKIEPEKIKDVENVMTVLGGKVIYKKR
ncbi:MAG TPA: amidohydrolase, partial [Candidatus Marinimicrobia bacterium]|nr:amidohydrolase [Candidatus Neomarinimicrobiota bacterium]